MLMRLILPSTIAVCESFVERHDTLVFLAEAQAIARAVGKRRNEFMTVRACARDAMRSLDIQAHPLLPGKGGAPSWPDEVVGSMTHCTGFRAAAVAKQEDFESIGIDAEPNRPLAVTALEVVARASEVDMLDLLQQKHPEVAMDRVLFCAKEAVYKAWFPLYHEYVGWHDIAVQLDASGFAARVQMQREEEAITFYGKWIANSRLICAACTVPLVGSTAANALHRNVLQETVR